MNSDIKKPFYKSPYLWIFIGAAIILPLIRPLLRRVPPPPEVIGHLPAYTLTNESGSAFGSEHLSGQVYVANFIFTRCTTVCPMISQSMAKLQERFASIKAPVKIVSFSVDPQHDTPEVLTAFGKKFGADFSRWTFLTGDEATVRKILEGGFMVVVGQQQPMSGGLIDIAHSQKAAIVDARGGVRGFYNTDETGIDEIFHRSLHVVADKSLTN